MSSVQRESNQSSTPKAFQEHLLVSRTSSGKMHVANGAFLKQKPGG